MKIETHTTNNIKIAEVISDDVIIKTVDDGLNLLGTLYYQGFDKIIIHEKNITPDFFNLKNGIAGEILQNFLIIVSGLLLLVILQNIQLRALKTLFTKVTKADKSTL